MKTKELQKKLMNNLIYLSKQKTDISEHLPLIFNLCVTKQAKTIIELGVKAGLSTQSFLAAASVIPDAQLYSYDRFPISKHSFFKGLGIKKRLPDYGTYDFFKFQIEYSTKAFNQWEQKSVDILFIDTKHEPEIIYKELSVWHDRIKPDGLILMHDVTLKKARLWEGIGDFQKDHPEFKYMECSYNNGLGILFQPLNSIKYFNKFKLDQ